ncbi:cytochrome c biogenesis CcdA family protein [Rhodobacteraceae bacterium]|nr:cytochrome c biogenesis CcdA family protein [Paracoccaceae bacterium]
MEYVLGYVAGLLTLINPCVLPILPIVLATSLQADRLGPIALAAGMSLSFVALGLGISAIGPTFGITPETIANVSALVMVAFGVVLLVPRLSESFATATAGFAARADAQIDTQDQNGMSGQFIAGLLLGAVWSPCIGPTLGGAISLASQGESLLHAGAIMVTFALGVSTLIIGLGYGTQSVIRKRQHWMRFLAGAARPIMGAVFVVVGLALFFKLHYAIELWIIHHLPIWIQDLSVIV